jgi:hypothetical protein
LHRSGNIEEMFGTHAATEEHALIVRLKKQSAAGPAILNCIREENTVTFQHTTAYFAMHDLIHLAVESELGYTQAFFRLVAAGRDIDSFGTRDGVKDTYTCEEAWAKSLVGILQWPEMGGGPELTASETQQQLLSAFAESPFGTPNVNAAQIQQIRAVIDCLHRRWAKVRPGDTIDFHFPLTAQDTAGKPA